MTLLALLIALPVGVYAATRPYSVFDQIANTLAFIGFSLPTFFTGLLLIYVFYYLLGWAPAPLGRLDVFASPPPQVTGQTIDAEVKREPSTKA